MARGALRTQIVALLAAITGLTCVPVLGTLAARADGDPASDVLLGENVFYPYTPAVAGGLQRQLTARAAVAAKAHFPIKVALIASPIDLGVIPQLFGKPQKYADFLDQEISFQGKQPLLVVMAAGYGVQGLSPAVAGVIGSLPKPGGPQSNDLARAALRAVAKLAAADGHPLHESSGSAGGGGGNAVLVVVLALAAIATASALLALRMRQAAPRRR